MMQPLRGPGRSDNAAHGGIAVIIPTYGQIHLTHRVLADLRTDQIAEFDVYVIDNGNSYESTDCEIVLKPGKNLGWAGGCNLGITETRPLGYEAFVLLNNDVRLSAHFIAGLATAWQETGSALLGPIYDHNWPQQRTSYLGPAANYEPAPHNWPVPFIDGTCMLIPSAAASRVGLLDAGTWPKYAWGCDKDYALRVRQVGGSVWVTERAYLNHIARQTVSRIPGFDERAAESENDRGMALKWGHNWRERLYTGFTTEREGLVQSRLAAENLAPPIQEGRKRKE